jgi:hypothetical protein
LDEPVNGVTGGGSSECERRVCGRCDGALAFEHSALCAAVEVFTIRASAVLAAHDASLEALAVLLETVRLLAVAALVVNSAKCTTDGLRGGVVVERERGNLRLERSWVPLLGRLYRFFSRCAELFGVAVVALATVAVATRHTGSEAHAVKLQTTTVLAVTLKA